MINLVSLVQAGSAGDFLEVKAPHASVFKGILFIYGEPIWLHSEAL